MQDVPLAPPPIAGGLEHDLEEEEEDEAMGPRLNLIVPQSEPSRPDSMLMTITGSIPIFETEDQEQETSLLTLPAPPPSPPSSEAGEFGEEAAREDDVPPIVPMTAPPPIPADESPMEAEDQSTEPLPPPTSEPPPLPLPGEEGEPWNELPTSRPPPIPILDESIFHSPDIPSLPPPLLPNTPTEVSEPSPDDDDDSSGRTPHGYIQLEVDLKKRAKGGLGVTVVSSGAPTNDLFMIRRIIAAGAAAKDGRLKPGDRLVAVNGKSLAGLHHAAVLQELNNAPKECHLTVWRDPAAFEAADATPPSYPTSRRSGSHSSLLTGSDDEQQLQQQQLEGLKETKRSLSISSLENSPLAVAKKLSVGKGLTPRGSPLVHNRLSLSSATAVAAAIGATPPAVNGTSPLTKRWSAEAALFAGPAGELMDDLTPPLSPPAPISSSPINPSPGGEYSPMAGGQTPELLPRSGGEIGMRDDLMNDDEFYRTETPPISTPPQPPSTPPPPIPSAPPPTMHRGMKLDLTKVAAAMKVAADDLISSSEDEEEDGGGNEEAPPPLPQTTPPPPAIAKVEEEEAPPPPPPSQTTPPPAEPEKEAPPPLPQTTPPPPPTETDKEAETNRSENEKGSVEVDRPKSLGPVPRGKRLEEAPFEIEVSKGILGGLGLTLCENELGMIAVKALTNRSPITKDGNIK
jgi:hypothetical protein